MHHSSTPPYVAPSGGCSDDSGSGCIEGGECIKILGMNVNCGLGKVDDAGAVGICISTDTEGLSLTGDSNAGVRGVTREGSKQHLDLRPRFCLGESFSGRLAKFEVTKV